MIGTVIDGSYRVDRLIGEGGFGVVYECTEIGLDRVVALKMLRPGVTGERELERFVTEGRHLASLNHPHVVQIYRLGNYHGNPYIVMEFVRGHTLREFLKVEQPTVQTVLEIMRQVAAGLAAMHAIRILHRDVSPANIVVNESHVAKILDLGLSKVTANPSTTQSHRYLAGTLAYVAPEQINGSDAGVASEVFAFGVILYEALTGVHPFQAEHHLSLLYNIGQRQAEPLAARLSHCPEGLSSLVDRMLEKRPERRPADMTEVEACLRSILAQPDVESSRERRIAPMATAEPRLTTQNPYLNRVMIHHRADFFGRTQEIKRIYARLNATPPGSISIVGDRKIGKSSLLNYVYMRANRNEHLEQVEKMVMVFLDLQGEKNMSMESFVRTLLGIANIELRGQLDVSDCSLDLDGIKDLVQRLHTSGFRLAILLDEFETVTTNPNFGLEFFSFLRYLANHYNVAYLTSSARDLQVLCHTQEISDSPFFNIFSTMRLSVFQRSEAEELIRVPSARVGKPLEPYIGPILDMAGLFPFFIQMACSHTLEYLEEHPRASGPDFNEIRRRFYEEAKLHYRYLWDSFDPHEKSTVLRVSQRKTMPDALRHVLAELETRKYVENAGGRTKLFASAFDDFVKSEADRPARPSFFRRLLGGDAV